MKMKTLNRLVVGTALALGVGCGGVPAVDKPMKSTVESLPESCAEVVSMDRSALRSRVYGYGYYVGCKDTDGDYRLYVCDSDGRKYSCNLDAKFEQMESDTK